MTVQWLLNAIGLFATTTSVLLLFLYLQAAPRFAQELKTDEARRSYGKYQRSLTVAVGLLAVWMILQYLSLIFL